MKRLMICILVASAALSCWATGQEGDIIFINGEKWTLLGEPIQVDSALSRHLREVLPENRSLCSSNWKGYTAYWSIRNEKLCLDSILVMFYNSETRKVNYQSIPDADMRNVFHDYYDNEDIVATWYTGRVREGQGALVRYEHSGFDRNHEHEQILTVKEGQVIDSITYHNRVVVDGFSFDDLYRQNKDKVAELIPFPVENYTELDPNVVGSFCVVIMFKVYDIQIDSLGNLLDCKVKVIKIKGLEPNQELEDRMALDMKRTLLNIHPWKLLQINGEYMPDCKSSIFTYEIKK